MTTALFTPAKRHGRPRPRPLLLLALAALLFSAGCGRNLEYRFPRGKTLVYTITEERGVMQDGEPSFGNPRVLKEVRFKIMPNVRHGYRIIASSHPPGNNIDPLAGKTLGELKIDLDSRGRVTQSIGTSLATELRYFIPELPPGLKRGTKWEDKISVFYRYKNLDVVLKHEFAGTRTVDDTRCSLIEGKANYSMEDSVNKPEQQINARLEFNFDYEENYCIDFSRGYLLRTDIYEQRKRLIYDEILDKAELDHVDMSRITIELVDVI